jgi:hypothetical protein
VPIANHPLALLPQRFGARGSVVFAFGVALTLVLLLGLIFLARERLAVGRWGEGPWAVVAVVKRERVVVEDAVMASPARRKRAKSGR